MGWNLGYTILEKQVITLYDNKLFSKEVLESIIEPFKGTDCDLGGTRKLLSKDGLCAAQIICKTMLPEEYEEAMENPEWWDDTENIPPFEEMTVCDRFIYNEKASKVFYRIWNDMWGIW